MKFREKLSTVVKKNKSMVCVGLDPDPQKMPVKNTFDFCKNIIDSTSDLVAAFKPNLAFFEAMGIDGLRDLKKIVEYLQVQYPEILIIGDGKRGDIDSTSAKYASAMFDYWGFDVVTVNAFAGLDGIEPFLKYDDKGVFVWCKSSNKSGVEIQDVDLSNSSGKFFHHLAKKSVEWDFNSNLGLVVGATFPEELKEVRLLAPNVPILLPGVGSQHGDLSLSVNYGFNGDFDSMLISSSRSIIFASSEINSFGESARKACDDLRIQINDILSVDIN
ncbi:MAG: orotidine-5'-phosphate decarboxylase [SAR202 cluster bacterium]|nr:orotidine-5'-phosphate decarboxylase [SAR202 cluster bacterium]